MSKVLYLCKYYGKYGNDTNGVECKHTSHIEQALNFKYDKDADTWVEQEPIESEWFEKGAYGNGTVFAPMQATYECPNCKLLTVTKTLYCPECGRRMQNGEPYYKKED